jgi:pimeloyl-ACP methyl ester carboxylesterase
MPSENNSAIGENRMLVRMMTTIACFGLFLILLSTSSAAADQEMVVLLHGFGRTDRSMHPLEERLLASGFLVRNLHYPSMKLSPPELTDFLDQELAACCSTAPRLHFVTHSLGGILVRAYLAEHHPPHLGRVVMIAPPNHGSEFSDLFGRSRLLRAVMGPTATQLGTGGDSLPNRLPPPWFDVGIIAGIDDFNPVGNFVVPQPSDGTVSLESTLLDGMADFVIVYESHTFIMRSRVVADYAICFLRTGRFHTTEPAGSDIIRELIPAAPSPNSHRETTDHAVVSEGGDPH